VVELQNEGFRKVCPCAYAEIHRRVFQKARYSRKESADQALPHLSPLQSRIVSAAQNREAYGTVSEMCKGIWGQNFVLMLTRLSSISANITKEMPV
jgi:hypothetical protein